MLHKASIHSTTKSFPNFTHFGRDLSTLYDTYVIPDDEVVLNANRTYEIN